MILTQFRAIYDDIAKSLEAGEPIHLWVQLGTCTEYHGIGRGELIDFGIVLLLLDDHPPIYIDVEAIVALGPWSGHAK